MCWNWRAQKVVGPDSRWSEVLPSSIVNLQHYLQHRRFYEVVIAIAVVLLITTTGATTEIIDNLRDGAASNWRAAWAKELSSGFSVLVLLPLIALFLRRMNLNYSNLYSRAVWLVPGFVVFSLLHIGMFTLIRMVVWASAGETYRFGSLGWSLLYEMRKDLLVYVGIVSFLSGYQFILNRLQGEARFLAAGSAQSSTSPQDKGVYRRQFLVKMLNKEYLVRVEEIDWVESASNYVLMHCGERSYPMRGTLSGLADELNEAQFIRVHRTAIVNLKRVESLNETGDLRAQLTSGDLVPISRTYLPDLKKALTAV